jgi:hypothetical protein
LRGYVIRGGAEGDQTMVMVIFTICCLILFAMVWPRVFFGTLGVLFVALILRIGFVLIESPDDKQQTARQVAPEAALINNRFTPPGISSMATRYAAPQSQREAEEKRKADGLARETQPALIVRRRTWIDTVENRRDVSRLPDASFGDSRLPDISF